MKNKSVPQGGKFPILMTHHRAFLLASTSLSNLMFMMPTEFPLQQICCYFSSSNTLAPKCLENTAKNSQECHIIWLKSLPQIHLLTLPTP